MDVAAILQAIKHKQELLKKLRQAQQEVKAEVADLSKIVRDIQTGQTTAASWRGQRKNKFEQLQTNNLSVTKNNESKNDANLSAIQQRISQLEAEIAQLEAQLALAQSAEKK